MLRPAGESRIGNWIGALALMLFPLVALASPMSQINTEGSGLIGASSVSSIDVSGVGFVQILPSVTTPFAFNFVEYGAYRAVMPDGMTALGAHDLTVTYSAFGIGSFLDPLGLRFTSGTIDVYSDPVFDFATANASYGADNGTLVARFSIFDGRKDASGFVTVNASAVPGTTLPGYFFAADGSDLSTHGRLMMTLGVLNQTVVPDDLMVAEVVCGLAGYTGPGCNSEPYLNTPFAFAVQDGGYAVIFTVPEPKTLGLLLAGLAVIPLRQRRRVLSFAAPARRSE